jgi:hypothetical protein
MSIWSRIFSYPEPIKPNPKLLEMIKKDLEKAREQLELDVPDVRGAKHSINLGLTVLGVLLDEKKPEPES